MQVKRAMREDIQRTNDRIMQEIQRIGSPEVGAIARA
jgi:hypothetical protein